MSYDDFHTINDGLVIYIREGSKKGVWQYRYTLSDGTYKRASTKVKDKNKAIEHAVLAVKDIEARLLQERPLDVGKFSNMAFFLKEDIKRWKNKDKRKTYLHALDTQLIPYFKEKSMDSFQVQHINTFKNQLNNEYKARTVNGILTGPVSL